MDDENEKKETAASGSALIPCPNCQEPVDVADYRQPFSCPSCDFQFVVYGRICPVCYHFHEKETAVCHQCGASLNRVCRQCYTNNWGGDEVCDNCGRSLDIFEMMSTHSSKATVDRLERQMQEAAAFKKAEAESSRKRMDELQDIEKERQTEIYRRRQKRQQEERVMLYTAVGILLVLALITLAYFLFFN